MKYILTLCTINDKKNAKKLAKKLLREKLCACVSIKSNLISFYFWKKKLQKQKEVILLIKTKKKLFCKLKKAILKYHSYDTPEILALNIKKANKTYLKWIKQNTKG